MQLILYPLLAIFIVLFFIVVHPVVAILVILAGLTMGNPHTQQENEDDS